MEIIKQIYYYFFYCFYKFWDWVSVPKFWSDTKSTITLIVLKTFIVTSIMYYFDLNLSKIQLILFCLIFIIVPNLYLFVFKDEWRSYLIYYDTLSKSQNRVYKSIVIFIVLLIFIFFLNSFRWADQRTRKAQTGPYSNEYKEQQKMKDSIDHVRYLKEMQDLRNGKQ